MTKVNYPDSDISEYVRALWVLIYISQYTTGTNFISPAEPSQQLEDNAAGFGMVIPLGALPGENPRYGGKSAK